jgi:hypothetical protein
VGYSKKNVGLSCSPKVVLNLNLNSIISTESSPNSVNDFSIENNLRLDVAKPREIVSDTRRATSLLIFEDDSPVALVVGTRALVGEVVIMGVVGVTLVGEDGGVVIGVVVGVVGMVGEVLAGGKSRGAVTSVIVEVAGMGVVGEAFVVDKDEAGVAVRKALVGGESGDEVTGVVFVGLDAVEPVVASEK